MSKEDKLDARKAELNLLLLQLRELKNATAQPMITHTCQALNEGEHVIDALWRSWPHEALRKGTSSSAPIQPN